MTNEEFLRRLEDLLRERLTPEQLDEVSAYHREYFDLAGPFAAQQLDPPEVIAQRVVEEYCPVLSNPVPDRRRRRRGAALLVLCLLLALGGLVVRKGVGRIIRRAVVAPVQEFSESMKDSVSIRVVEPGEVAPFRTIHIKGDVAEVAITRGETYSVTQSGHHQWEFTSEGGVLTLTDKNKHHERATLKITVPDPFLDEVEVNIVDGYVTLGEFCADSIDIELSKGAITLDGCTAKEIDLRVVLGSITATLAGEQADWSLDLETGLVGEAEVSGKSVGRSYETEHGQFRLDAEVDVGDIQVDFIPETIRR